MSSSSDYDLRVINLGAGVQSTVVYLLSCGGDLPEVDFAVFADTQLEPQWVYDTLDWLEEIGHIPIHRVTNGNLEQNLRSGGVGRPGDGHASIPLFTLAPDGSRGFVRRQCTGDYKIKPIERFIRESLGLKKGQRAAGKYHVEQWLGITTDESGRASKSGNFWLKRHYPLLFDYPMRRSDCIEWLRSRGYELPRKSSCFMCPFHSDTEWRTIKMDAPELWARAVRFDEDLRKGQMVCTRGLDGKAFLHAARVPLSEVDLDATIDKDQPDLWGRECAGVCGV